MARNGFWRIEHAFSNGPDDATPIPFHDGPQIPTTPGQSYTLTVALTGDANSLSGAWLDADGRWELLQQIGGPASSTVVHEMPGDQPHPYTVVGKTAGVGGGLVTLYPPDGTPYDHGGHYACTSVTETGTPAHVASVKMELTRLASLDDYPDRAAARESLEAPI